MRRNIHRPLFSYSTVPSYSMLIYALALVPMALACGPAAGPTTDRPTLKFNYSAPLAWTYMDPLPVSGGQSLSKDAAQNRINADIEFAVIKALESYGYSSTGVKVAPGAIVPDGPFNIVATCTASFAKEAYAEGGVVTRLCIKDGDPTTDTAGKDATHIGTTLSITSPVALALSQWENISIKIWQELTTTAGVKFQGLIEVSK